MPQFRWCFIILAVEWIVKDEVKYLKIRATSHDDKPLAVILNDGDFWINHLNLQTRSNPVLSALKHWSLYILIFQESGQCSMRKRSILSLEKVMATT